MKINFDNLSDLEKFKLAETYLNTRKTISTMDIVTVASIFGVTISEMIGSMADSDFFRFAPLATIPLFVVFACKKIKLSKRYKKASNSKVNYAKLRKAEFGGEIEELYKFYENKVDENTKIAINLAKIAGRDTTQMEQFLKDREEKRKVLNQIEQENKEEVEVQNVELDVQTNKENENQQIEIENQEVEEIKEESKNIQEEILEQNKSEDLENKQD